MTAVGIIPARYAASRFPGKALAPIAGRPMVRRVWEGARTAKSLRTVMIATDDERIARVCADFGAEVAMTSPDHPTGTDRLAEVARDLGIAPNVLHRWVQQLEEQDPATAFPGSGQVNDADDEVRRLRRELERVKQERDFLKKAAAFFARESP